MNQPGQNHATTAIQIDAVNVKAPSVLQGNIVNRPAEDQRTECISIEGAETFPPVQVFLPRWSPDGKRIAFAATMPGKPQSIYVISAEGGQAARVTKDQNNELDVGWSPDGNQLVFGLAPPFGSSGPAIYLLNLKTHERSTLPGSEGLFSPRLSPDGHYIAAATIDSASLRLYDFAIQKWGSRVNEAVGAFGVEGR